MPHYFSKMLLVCWYSSGSGRSLPLDNDGRNPSLHEIYVGHPLRVESQTRSCLSRRCHSPVPTVTLYEERLSRESDIRFYSAVSRMWHQQRTCTSVSHSYDTHSDASSLSGNLSKLYPKETKLYIDSVYHNSFVN